MRLFIPAAALGLVTLLRQSIASPSSLRSSPGSAKETQRPAGFSRACSPAEAEDFMSTLTSSTFADCSYQLSTSFELCEDECLALFESLAASAPSCTAYGSAVKEIYDETVKECKAVRVDTNKYIPKRPTPDTPQCTFDESMGWKLAGNCHFTLLTDGTCSDECKTTIEASINLAPMCRRGVSQYSMFEEVKYLLVGCLRVRGDDLKTNAVLQSTVSAYKNASSNGTNDDSTSTSTSTSTRTSTNYRNGSIGSNEVDKTIAPNAASATPPCRAKESSQISRRAVAGPVDVANRNLRSSYTVTSVGIHAPFCSFSNPPTRTLIASRRHASLHHRAVLGLLTLFRQSTALVSSPRSSSENATRILHAAGSLPVCSPPEAESFNSTILESTFSSCLQYLLSSFEVCEDDCLALFQRTADSAPSCTVDGSSMKERYEDMVQDCKAARANTSNKYTPKRAVPDTPACMFDEWFYWEEATDCRIDVVTKDKCSDECKNTIEASINDAPICRKHDGLYTMHEAAKHLLVACLHARGDDLKTNVVLRSVVGSYKNASSNGTSSSTSTNYPNSSSGSNELQTVDKTIAPNATSATPPLALSIAALTGGALALIATA